MIPIYRQKSNKMPASPLPAAAVNMLVLAYGEGFAYSFKNMATITYFARPVVPEAWVRNMCAETEMVLSEDVDLLPPEQFRAEAISQHDTNNIPSLHWERVTELRKSMTELRGNQSNEGIVVDTTKILIKKRQLLLGLVDDPRLQQDRVAVSEMISKAIGKEYACSSEFFRFRVHLGRMRDTSSETYKRVMYHLTDTVMPASVRLGPIAAEVLLVSRGERFTI